MKNRALIAISILLISSTIFILPKEVEAETSVNEYDIIELSDESETSYFIENMGQWDDSILFAASTDFGHVAITPEGILYDVMMSKDGVAKGHVLIMMPVDGNMDSVKGRCSIPGVHNFLIGNDRSRWVAGARAFEKVVIEDVWQGIDMEYYTHGSSLKYDIVLEPYAARENLMIEVIGAESLRPTTRGLSMDIGHGIEIVDGELLAFEDDDKRNEIEIHFTTPDEHIFSFDLSNWDGSKPLRIDPLVFSTFAGGQQDDSSNGMATDDDGNVYITGQTNSMNFPTTAGAYGRTWYGLRDGFVSKFDSTGSNLIFSTYFGGESYDYLMDVEVSSDGGIWVAGVTNSIDIPTTDNAYNKTKNGEMTDIIVVKFDSTGSDLVYSTYLGGTDSESILGARSIAEDDQGRLVIGGVTSSSDFPVTADAFDSIFDMMARDQGILTVIDPESTDLYYSTFIGGDMGTSVISVRTDDEGCIYLSGNTHSIGIPTTPDAYLEDLPGMGSMFIMKLDLSLYDPIVSSTYFGGPHISSLTSMDIDEEGAVYITGKTMDIGFPISEDAYQHTHRGNNDGFISKLNPSLSALVFSTFLGGSDYDEGKSVCAEPDGGATISGITRSRDIYSMINYTSNDPEPDNLDVFIFRINDDGTESPYVTVFGGKSEDSSSEMLLTSNGDTIITGHTRSADFPVTEGSYSQGHSGRNDCFILKMNMTLPPGPVNDIRVSQNDGFINISWKNPSYDGGLPIHTYRIYRGALPSVIGLYNNTDVDKNNFADIDVIVGEEYYYRVSAVNGAGEGPLSPTYSKTVVSRPEAPINFRVVPEEEAVNVMWNKPYITGDLDIESYRIYRSNGTDDGEMIHEAGMLERRFFDDGLQNGVTYIYWMTAVNRIGESDPTDKHQALPQGLPSVPRGLGLDLINGTVRITWNAPDDDGGAEIEGYEILKQLENGGSYLIEVSDGMEFIDTEVMVGKEYSYSIRARTSLGRSEETAPISIFVMTVPTAPLGIRGDGGDGVCYIYWNEPASSGGVDLENYLIYRSEEDDERSLVAESSPSQPFYIDRDVENGMVYNYSIVAVNEKGESVPSEYLEIMPRGKPSEPQVFTAVQVNDTMVLQWNPPSDNGGAEITGYIITRTLGDDSTMVNVDGDARRYVDDQVFSGVDVTYSIEARNAIGNSEKLTIDPVTLISVPDLPVEITLSRVEEGVLIDWEAPASNGGSEITGYVVMRSLNGTDEWEEIGSTRSDETDYIDIVPVFGSVHHYAVKALNSRGPSAPSDVVIIQPSNVPGVPTKPVVAMDGHLEIRWSSPSSDGGGQILYYIVERSEDGIDFQRVATVLPGIGSYIDHDTEPGREYHYRVIAVNDIGEGEPSEISRISVPEDEGKNLLGSIPPSLYIGLIGILLLAVIILLVMVSRKGKEQNIPEPTPSPALEDPMQQYPNDVYGGQMNVYDGQQEYYQE